MPLGDGAWLSLYSKDRKPDGNRDGSTLAEDQKAVSTTISSLIAAADRNDRAAREELFGALYAELHRLARRELARGGSAGSLGVTTLLHEAYLEHGGARRRARFRIAPASWGTPRASCAA